MRVERPVGLKDSWVGVRVDVCFNYDTAHKVGGEIVRDDPTGITIIKLDDGRYVLGSECQYSPVIMNGVD